MIDTEIKLVDDVISQIPDIYAYENDGVVHESLNEQTKDYFFDFTVSGRAEVYEEPGYAQVVSQDLTISKLLIFDKDGDQILFDRNCMKKIEESILKHIEVI